MHGLQQRRCRRRRRLHGLWKWTSRRWRILRLLFTQCSADCLTCAPGYVPVNPGDNNNGACVLCGNGVLDDGEVCDWGSDYNCANTCNYCVDSIHIVVNGVCSRCGNGYLDAGEACDSLRQGCTADCKGCKTNWVPADDKFGECTTCGNGRIEPDEVCDVLLDGSKCSSDCGSCVHPYAPVGRRCVLCGNGQLDSEVDADGNTIFAEACDAAQPGCQKDCSGCEADWTPSGLDSGVCVPACGNCCEIQKERLGEVPTEDVIDSAGFLAANLAVVFVFLLSVLN